MGRKSQGQPRREDARREIEWWRQIIAEYDRLHREGNPRVEDALLDHVPLPGTRDRSLDRRLVGYGALIPPRHLRDSHVRMAVAAVSVAIRANKDGLCECAQPDCVRCSRIVLAAYQVIQAARAVYLLAGAEPPTWLADAAQVADDRRRADDGRASGSAGWSLQAAIPQELIDDVRDRVRDRLATALGDGGRGPKHAAYEVVALACDVDVSTVRRWAARRQ